MDAVPKIFKYSTLKCRKGNNKSIKSLQVKFNFEQTRRQKKTPFSNAYFRLPPDAGAGASLRRPDAELSCLMKLDFVSPQLLFPDKVKIIMLVGEISINKTDDETNVADTEEKR